MIDRITVEKIMDAARIEEVVGDYVTLKRAGANLKGLCPFHDDRTPSFVVSPVKNYCHCFACGEGGNAAHFLMKVEQISYREALLKLAKKYGISVEERELSAEEKQANDDRESMFILNEWARDWFRHQLNDTEDGRAVGLAYFRGRGFRDDILEKFQVGFCPKSRKGGMAEEARKAGFKEEFIINTPDPKETTKSIGTGLAFKNDNGILRDRFYDRVIWPIFTAGGRVAGFGGRVMDAATKGVAMKYTNSPDSLVYSKRRELFGLYQAKKAIQKNDECYLVEGYTDVMAMHQCGVENVVASSGTALTDEQIRMIHRITNNFVVIYDGDAAGIKASQRGIDMILSHGMNVKLISLPDNDDPDSFARKHNATEFQEYMQTHRVDFIRFKTNLLMEESKGDTGRMRSLIGNITQSIAVIPDPITRALYIRETADMLSLPESLLAQDINNKMAKMQEERDRERQRQARIWPHAAGTATQEPTVPPTPENFPPQDIPEEPVPAFIPPVTATSTTTTKEVPQQPVVQPATNPHERMTLEEQRRKERIYLLEREIIKAVVRYGERVIGVLEDKPTKVVEFLQAALEQDKLTLRDNTFRAMFEESVAHLSDPDFVAERYFINHVNPRFSELAYLLSTEKVQLSRMFDVTDRYNANENRDPAYDLAHHVLTDYKLAIVDEQIDKVMEQMTVVKDMDEMKRILERFQALKQSKKQLSKTGGDRVLG